MFNLFQKDKKDPKNLEEAIAYIKELDGKIDKIVQELTELRKKHKWTVQKVGIVRFNPFHEVGSDQSFSLALLDENNDGVVISSLYTREENRIYGKPIKNTQSEYSLSAEEKKAIEIAIAPKNA